MILNLIFTLLYLVIIVIPHSGKGKIEKPKQVESPIPKKTTFESISTDFSSVNFSATKLKKAIVINTPSNLGELFSKYSQEFSVDKNTLAKIADCESHFHPASQNGDYAGMFQFARETWSSTRSQMTADPNPDLRFNAQEAIKTAAFKISHGGISSWPICSL